MVEVAGGNLVLHAARKSRDGYPYIAGQVSTKDKLTVGPYGRLTTRQLIGPGHGLGVGVCLYGADIDAVGWPACGEIDATEVAVARSEQPFGSLHGPGYSGSAPLSATWSGEPLVDRWAEHVLEWEPGRLSWAIDGEIYHTAESADPRATGGWPFDQPFFITIVMTVGSHLSGPVNESTWPQDSSGAAVDPYFAVDFIRFEQRRT
ncbi:glycoside hydrolase family 16 protein [Arthrobacter sedimenti]|uniref:glycoside hydrolase family 16 protein n=1 Tax=Arthrobacter sedimenti TaxID=2694931 RepID=UPI001CDBC7BA|nr:glycoside hydrolase family 16 protein [Arthrobacter sedimenti]